MPHTKPLILAVLSLFLLAGTAPMVLADDEDEGKRGDDDRHKERDHREGDGRRGHDDDDHREGKDREEHADDDDDEDERERHVRKGVGGNTTLELNGTGVAKRDNLTYSVSLTCDGKGQERLVDGNATKYKARCLAHGVVKSANGTVVKEGDFRVKLKASLDDDGDWAWHLESVKKRPDGMPRLNLHGDATATADGLQLEDGHGKVVFKQAGSDKATNVKLSDVSGDFAFTLRPPRTT